MHFIGRKRELELLESACASDHSELIPVYGRRRVGKSELLLRFIRNRPAVYFLGKRAPAAVQLREFLGEAAGPVGAPLLADMAATGWRQALLAVVDSWKGPGKLILVFDEFQWLAEASPELPSVLQECWDRWWKGSGRVMLILCGSFVGFMEREVLGRKSPLFGRRTAQILLRPFGYREAAKFHPSWSYSDKARVWILCGGIPLYLRHFQEDRSVEENIARLLLDEYGPLFREPDFLLREELREVESYYAVLMAMTSGAVSLREIAAASGVPERSLPYYLNQLVQLGHIARHAPLSDRRPGRLAVRYQVEDPLLRFWFRFVFPNMSRLAHAGAEAVLAERIRPLLDSFYGSGFERLCREALPALYVREGVKATFEVGEYWDRRVQVDLVGLRSDGWTDLGECRWGAVRSTAGLARELDEKARLYPNDRNATVGLRLFTRSAVKSRPAGLHRSVRWHCLEDLYA